MAMATLRLKATAKLKPCFVARRATVVRAAVHQRLVAEPERVTHVVHDLPLPRDGATELARSLRRE